MNESDYIEKIKSLCQGESFDATESLRLVEEGLREHPSSAELHCMRGDLIQLSDGPDYELPNALESYERAVEIDPDCAEAHESIGYYCDVIITDLPRAEAAFRRAIELRAGIASYVGLSRVLAERGRKTEEVLSFLDTCPHPDAPKVREIRAEIASGHWKQHKPTGPSKPVRRSRS